MTKKDFKPVKPEEIEELVKLLSSKDIDAEQVHGWYDNILERYVLYLDKKLAGAIERLVLIRQTHTFYYA